ncbi:hypothetical protein ECTW00353_2933, partial [Escherichia coli TW00353]
MAWLIS